MGAVSAGDGGVVSSLNDIVDAQSMDSHKGVRKVFEGSDVGICGLSMACLASGNWSCEGCNALNVQS